MSFRGQKNLKSVFKTPCKYSFILAGMCECWTFGKTIHQQKLDLLNFWILFLSFTNQWHCVQERNLERGLRYIYNRKDEIIHGISPSVICVAPLFGGMSLAKEWNAGGGTPPAHSLPLTCAPVAKSLKCCVYLKRSEKKKSSCTKPFWNAFRCSDFKN